MRAVSACLLFVVAAAVVSAQSCTAPASDALNATSTSSCASVTACQTALCSCAGGSSASAALPACLAGSTKTCADTTTCFTAYFACLTALSSLRNSNSSGAACTAYGSALYMNQLAAATTISTFNSSNLYNSCTYGVCTLLNATGVSGCSSSNVTTAACASTVLLKDAVGPTPTPTTTMGVYAVTATFQLSGQNWTLVMTDPTAYNTLVSKIKSDLAAYFIIDQTYIVILDLSLGSLVIQFAVLTGSGKSAEALQSAASSAATASDVFPEVTNFYGGYGTDTPTVTVTSVATPPPTPAPSSAMNVAVLAAAAVAAAATLFA